MIKHGIKGSLSGMLILLVTVATLARCGGDEQQIEELTKEKVKKIEKADWWDDFCEIYGWYGDGICDNPGVDTRRRVPYDF